MVYIVCVVAVRASIDFVNKTYTLALKCEWLAVHHAPVNNIHTKYMRTTLNRWCFKPRIQYTQQWLRSMCWFQSVSMMMMKTIQKTHQYTDKIVQYQCITSGFVVTASVSIHRKLLLRLTLLFRGKLIETFNKNLWLDSLNLYIGLTTLYGQTTLRGYTLCAFYFSFRFSRDLFSFCL